MKLISLQQSSKVKSCYLNKKKAVISWPLLKFQVHMRPFISSFTQKQKKNVIFVVYFAFAFVFTLVIIPATATSSDSVNSFTY